MTDIVDKSSKDCVKVGSSEKSCGVDGNGDLSKGDCGANKDDDVNGEFLILTEGSLSTTNGTPEVSGLPSGLLRDDVEPVARVVAASSNLVSDKFRVLIGVCGDGGDNSGV